VTLSAASSQTVTVDYATSNGNATAASDYQATSGTLSFAPGVTTGNIDVALTADSLDELDETFVLTLSTPSNATLGTGSATAVILDDDATPTLSVGDVTVTEGDSGTVNASFTVSLSAASGREVSVGYTTADASALAGSDYVTTSGTLLIPAGTSALAVDVPIIGDTFAEGTETFMLRIAVPVGATIADDTGLGTVLDSDQAAVLSIGGATVTEGNSGAQNATFTVTLSPAAAQAVTVTFATADGSALAGSDYTATSGTLTFDPGVTSRTVIVPILGDTRDEPAETFTVVLGTATGATIGSGTGTGTIVDNDAPPTMVIGNVTVTEGTSGTATANFVVTLSAASGLPISIDFASADGTALAGADYTATTGTLSFDPGTTSRTIAVPVLGDVLDEANETFTVLLSNPVNVTVADASGLGTISDDDARPSLRVNDVTVTEGHSGTVEATFTVTLSAPSGLTVTVTTATVNGTAIAGSDYTAVSGTLTFAPGDTSRTVTVSVLGDVLDEANETFTLRLSSAINASVADSSGRGTVTDDDPLPTLAINDVTVSEDELTATFTVALSTVSGRTVTVRYATLNGTAISGSDYTSASGTLSFAAGSTTATVTVPILNDVVTEGAEAFSVRLSSASNASIADNTGVCTITANDSP
jgi:ribosomal protein L35AE/L33A